VWIVLGLVALACLTWLAHHWIREHRRTRTATSRHQNWAWISAELPHGSRLTGIDEDSRTTVEIGAHAPCKPQESRGGR
jgi:hypothetical protein